MNKYTWTYRESWPTQGVRPGGRGRNGCYWRLPALPCRRDGTKAKTRGVPLGQNRLRRVLPRTRKTLGVCTDLALPGGSVYYYRYF